MGILSHNAAAYRRDEDAGLAHVCMYVCTVHSNDQETRLRFRYLSFPRRARDAAAG